MEDILHIRIEFPWSNFDGNKVVSTLPHVTVAYGFDPYEEMDILIKGIADINLLWKLRNPHQERYNKIPVNVYIYIQDTLCCICYALIPISWDVA